MLSMFPELLFLSPIADTIIRVVVATVVLYAAYMQAQRVDVLREIPFSFLGAGSWVVWFSVAFDTVVGGLLLVGIYTQPVALIGALGMVITLLFARKYHESIPIPRMALLLTLIMTLTLVLSGAGAFAFDLPL